MAKRRSNAEILATEDLIMSVAEEAAPSSVRHIFYKMTDPTLPISVPKTHPGYIRVMRHCQKLRLQGRMPYEWIVDDSRHAHLFSGYNSGAMGNEDFALDIARKYRYNYWYTTPYHVEAWVESRSLAGMIARECSDAGVSLYPCNGFPSMTYLHNAAKHVVETARDKPILVVLYAGDYDPSGVQIGRNLEVELEEYVRAAGYEGEFIFLRLAVTEEQISLYNLPSKVRKESDKRALDVTVAVEAESMDANLLRSFFRDSFATLMPQEELEMYREKERLERKDIYDYLMNAELWRVPVCSDCYERLTPSTDYRYDYQCEVCGKQIRWASWPRVSSMNEKEMTWGKGSDHPIIAEDGVWLPREDDTPPQHVTRLERLLLSQGLVSYCPIHYQPIHRYFDDLDFHCILGKDNQHTVPRKDVVHRSRFTLK